MENDVREVVIRRYFQAWLEQDQALLNGIFEPSVVYSESWGPEYAGLEKVLYWFNEWNCRAHVIRWDIKQFIHQGKVTAVEWRFRNRSNTGEEEYFDGVSLFTFSPAGLVSMVKEFGSKLPHYDPYEIEQSRPSGSQLWLAE